VDDPLGGEGNETNWLKQVGHLPGDEMNMWMIHLEERGMKQAGYTK
jgi:hypothetical protein